MSVAFLVALSLAAADPEAKLLDAPIVSVTVHRDRARVVRSVALPLTAGEHRLRFPDLPGATLVDTLRLATDRGRVLRIETASVDRERFSLDEVDALIEQLEKLDDRDRALDAEQKLLERELSLLSGIRPDPPVSEEKRQGRPMNVVAPEVWPKVLDFFADRRTAIFERQRGIAAERRKIADERSAVQQAAQRFSPQAFSDRRLQVTVVIAAAAPEKHTIELEYFVPGAQWRPGYSVRVDAEKSTVRLDRAALVTQASGEEWPRVDLSVSTGAGQVNIDLPELLTWTLGEAKEPTIVVRPVTPRSGGLLPLPPPARVRPSEAEAQARLELLRAHASDLSRRSGGQAIGGKVQVDFSDDTIDGALTKPEGTFYGARRRSSKELPKPSAPPPPAPPPPAPPPAEPEAAMDLLSVQEERSVRPAVVASSRARPAEQPPQVQGLSLAEPPPKPADLFGTLMKSPLRLTVPGTGSEIRAPLETQELKAVLSYEASPALELTAFMIATVENLRGLPQGNATIYVGDTFVADSFLAANNDGKLVLPLGADPDVRITRKVMPSSVTQGVFSKDDITTYRVVIEVGNYKKRPIAIRITEPLPRTGQEKIKVEQVSASPPLSQTIPERGHVIWALTIPATKTQTLELVYKLSRPSDMKVWTR